MLHVGLITHMRLLWFQLQHLPNFMKSNTFMTLIYKIFFPYIYYLIFKTSLKLLIIQV